MRSTLNLYIGSPEEDPNGSYAYLDLNMSNGAEIELLPSPINLSDLSDDSIVEVFEKLLNDAGYFKAQLKLPLQIFSVEELVSCLVEEMVSHEAIREVTKLLKDFKSGQL